MSWSLYCSVQSIPHSFADILQSGADVERPWRREAVAAAPGAPGHVLSYMHALEIMQHYAHVLAAARQLLLTTR